MWLHMQPAKLQVLIYEVKSQSSKISKVFRVIYIGVKQSDTN